jgi:hypothetical protein
LGHELKTTLENREFGHTARSATSRFSFAGSSFIEKISSENGSFQQKMKQYTTKIEYAAL